MKKTAHVILSAALAFAFLLLCACGGNGGETQAPASGTGDEGIAADGSEAVIREDDGVRRILMIGNSFCFYYAEDLYGLLSTAGEEAVVANVYYSGCPLQRHVLWYENGEANYEYYVTDRDGRSKKMNASLAYCLDAQDWDVISIQQHFYPALTMDQDATMNSCRPAADELVAIIREHCPEAELCWHETWAYQTGYSRDDTLGPVTEEIQTTQYQTIRDVSREVAEELGLRFIPCGDAWQAARSDPSIGDTLCCDSTRNDGLGDDYHDGNIGGGQYLNACVWFETLTGKSVVGNLFYPAYSLTRDKMNTLQRIAHETVTGEKARTGVQN